MFNQFYVMIFSREDKENGLNYSFYNLRVLKIDKTVTYNDGPKKKRDA